MSAAATATLSDSTAGRIGMLTNSAAVPITGSVTPAPSAPRTIAVGARRSSCGSGVPPRGTAATSLYARISGDASDILERAARADRKVERSPHRSAQCLPSERICRPLDRDHAGGTACGSRPDDGADVTRILDAGQDEDEGRQRGGVGSGRERGIEP